MHHIPVLLAEVIEHLRPQKGETVIDVTLGLGGHAAAFVEKIGKKGTLIGLETDEKNLEEAKKKLQGENIQLHHANFRDLTSLSLPKCDVLFADLGLSSPHLDDPERGFSFHGYGPLDCRFDQTKGITAAELIAQKQVGELQWILQDFGELPKKADLLAKALKEGKPRTMPDLCAITETVYGFQARSFLPQILQALRIVVNEEMDALTILLREGPALLKEGGRMGIISYHSLEDRMVKQRFRELSNGQNGIPATYDLLTPHAIRPTMEEVESNSRARSARLRILQKRS